MAYQTLAVKNALADLGANINLMPHSLFRRLGISKLKPTRMSIQLIQLADRSIKYPIEVCENLLVKVVPKKGGMTIVKNEKNELIPQRKVTGWRVCIDYRKLNNTTQKDHFPFPFIDQMLERLAGHEYYCFLDGFSGYFQIPISLEDQEKITFTCPYGNFAYKRMPFRLCNAPATF
ncbi:hypothetical protein Tco_0646003 [Tanacetum coccineum]